MMTQVVIDFRHSRFIKTLFRDTTSFLYHHNPIEELINFAKGYNKMHYYSSVDSKAYRDYAS
jgi:hypothetical protein